MCQPETTAPGKVAPKTAGVIIADAISQMIEESRVT